MAPTSHPTTQPTPDGARLDVAALAAATPEERDRVVDLVRVACIVVVVLGHWLMAVVTADGNGIEGRNLLSAVGWTTGLTWVFQVMPIFFLVGGVANAASWSSARRRLVGYPAWLHGRVDRLTRPVAGLVIAWAAGLAVAQGLGAPADALGMAARLVAMPVWFLAVYIGVVAAAPLTHALHERAGAATLCGLAGAALAVDAVAGPVGVARAGGLGALAWLNFAFVWLFAHQLGYWWRDGRLQDRRTALTLTAGGAAGLVVLAVVLGYPVSMVGGAGERSNMTPPSAAILALAVGQAGLLALARPALARWAKRPAVWRTVIRGNAVAMTIYLWHLTALCLATVALLVTGLFPQPPVGSGGWWALRPAWLVALAATLAPLVALWSRLELAPRRQRTSRCGLRFDAAAAVGAITVAGGLAWLSIRGVPRVGVQSTLVAPALLVAGVLAGRTALLRELRPS